MHVLSIDRPAEYFHIISHLNGLCLDVYKADPTEGTQVVMWSKADETQEHQLWYEDRYGYIRSKLNNMILDASSKCFQAQQHDPRCIQ